MAIPGGWQRDCAERSSTFQSRVWRGLDFGKSSYGIVNRGFQKGIGLKEGGIPGYEARNPGYEAGDCFPECGSATPPASARQSGEPVRRARDRAGTGGRDPGVSVQARPRTVSQSAHRVWSGSSGAGRFSGAGEHSSLHGARASVCGKSTLTAPPGTSPPSVSAHSAAIPLDGLRQCFREFPARLPGEFPLRLAAINGVAPVVPGPVGDVADEALRLA